MFTGIVEATGRSMRSRPSPTAFASASRRQLAADLAPGASLAVNGVCLTVVVIDGRHVVADIGPETARITTLGLLRRGQHVNLERPLRLDGRLDGHFVQGHVDGMGIVSELRHEADSHWLTVQFPPRSRPFSSARARWRSTVSA